MFFIILEVVMEKIIYRSIKKQDYNYIGDLIVKVFKLDEYITNNSLLKTIKLHYVYGCLAEATYINIAEIDNKIVGIIMGNSSNDWKFFRQIHFIIFFMMYELKLWLLSYQYKEELASYRRIQQIYKNLLSKHKDEFDGVLTLFLVDEYYRKIGIGYKLLNNLLIYLKKQKTKKIYLYTDNTCNYIFYEKNGFKRIEEDNLSTLKRGKEFNMTIFLYEYLLS